MQRDNTTMSSVHHKIILMKYFFLNYHQGNEVGAQWNSAESTTSNRDSSEERIVDDSSENGNALIEGSLDAFINKMLENLVHSMDTVSSVNRGTRDRASLP